MTTTNTPRPYRRRLALLLGLLLGLVALPACSTGGDRPRIVVTTNILGDITREIAGTEAEVTVLMKPNADPHSFGLSAAEAATLEQADLVVFNGLGLEENVLRHVDNARRSGVPVFEVGAAADPLTYRSADSGTHGDAGEPDPHFWTDPDRVRKAVGLIADRITEHVTGVDRNAVRANAQRYEQQLADLTSWMTRSFDRIPVDRRALVTNHHVFGYLADRFGFRVVGAVIPSGTTLASPSSSDLHSLTRTMRDAGVRTIFADSSRPQRLAEVLREEMGGDVRVVGLHSESLTDKGGGADTYLSMMRANTEALISGLTPR
ncbi:MULTISPECIES: zinc ABC transporter substrate-binding protein AztC [Streptomyces]|uniref:Zinc ABC transporter substrate-binding protein n=1 Tax=Streptomyces tsukubensis (strain DSM 42081 / NBRC 108919 / NRRL 18488 / 9993) TaxID=1114943 RepID=I2N813_STRT9|nr:MULTISPECIES: zinc ABC transporter substrate-binding protein AztC [Streptomyces]AZK97008.1 zinc ABC transporter substrate-binding protein [Streptomyces tsukubensis]EIF93160.1 periplasmic solute binding protein [Streptomyces tsukubensis NRRL18488]MYS66556.1 zinc ABC transporter solute-binding protein [Streptomyces sp. SID5473]QKM67013.1 zinc ABC transporter substrate-binding protein [Streptomyces tsukubensis NRRL18488]TAI41508.1 zinc ABC transporter substrate-binding protein [Streptomyces ts